ncbi:antitoxin Xre/MbcA/ParS toxin-binding domain-containing protein [Agromyces bauzanensis]
METQERRRPRKSFKLQVIAAVERQLEAMPEEELRLTDDESPEEVASRFVASRRARNEWDRAVGPFLDTAGVVTWLSYGNRQNVSNAVERGDLLAVMVGRRMLYPRFQFSDSGQLLPRLREVLPILREQMESPWTQALWLNTPVPAFGERTPAELLQRGDGERVLQLAQADVERRAQ